MIPTIKIPMFDNAFEFQIQLESPVFDGTVLALYIKRKGEEENIPFPNATGSGEESYHWDSYEAKKTLKKGTEITYKLDGTELYKIAGVNKKYYGQIVIYDKDTKERKETVQPAKFKVVTEIKQ